MRKKQISKDNVKAQTALLETRKKAYDLTLKELKDLDEMYVLNVGESLFQLCLSPQRTLST